MSKKKVSRSGFSGYGGGGGGAPSAGGGGGGGLNQQAIMAQVQKLQAEMGAAQDALKDEIVEASVGGGVVTVRMTGAQDLVGISIKPEVVDPDDVETLQDLLVAAFNEANQKAKDLADEKMAPFTSMLGGFGGLF
jgi:DNA-binding YbaB/EbfC family protein